MMDTRGDVIDYATEERTRFIIAPDGKVAATVRGLPPAANVENSLKLVLAFRTASQRTLPLNTPPLRS